MKGIFLRKEWGSILCCLCIIGACLVHMALGQGTKDAMFPMMDATIVLDAGHGGWDPGKTGTNGADEKLLNLAVVEKLAEYLEQGGAEVILTRDSDAALGKGKKADMAERKKIANETGADLLVSIHQNAFPSARAKGAQVFYHKSSEKGKVLAECVQESLRSRVDGSNIRQAKENKEYYILRTTEIPAVIVECGFLSNAEEERLLNDAEYQEKLAWAIYCGILDYFENLDMI
ncbi:MAG: N-acetylmuramoyl-L-alanine amidase [Bacteroidales bacterium]|nr:N-acetylmuramoyl-L-alanine amidase [Anaerotignum sp.]MCI5678997.1 N-acetylmuramoyl-L-alanine amidase [Bacteroidales bacterium]MDY3927548.1 N-acetylmuramoyl-L-alanine amidase [Anaerotignum sp.]